MKKTINIILFILICNLGYSQFSCVKTITKNGCKLNLFNANLVKVGEIDLSKSAWYFQSATNIKIADNVNVFNFINTCVTSPTWSALPDSLTSWQNQCVTTSATFPTNLDTTQQDTALDKSVTVSNLENYRNVLDSINNKLHSIAFDTSTIDTSLVPQIDYTALFYALINRSYDTSQADTSMINYVSQFDRQNDTLSGILYAIQNIEDTTHTAILNHILDSINSKLSLLDKSDVDTSLVQVIQLNQIIDSLSVLINKPSLDTTHEAILNNIYTLIGKLDTSSIDTSLVPTLDYSELFYALINKGYDTSQVDTALDKHILLDSTSVRILNDSIKVWFTQPLEVSKDTTHQTILSEIKELLTVINNRVDTTQQDTSLDKSIKLDSTLVRIINDTLNVRFIDSTYYTQLDSIKYYLSLDDSIEICFDTITFQTYVTNLPTTICNGDSAVRVQLCNTDSTLNAIVRTKIDTTNAILYRIENKNITDTTHTAILREISDTLTHLAEILNELKSDCIGSNETYYINGTNSVTINASEVCSYTITVIGGDVDFSENGVSSPFSFPNGYTGSSSFKNGTKFLINQITFTGTNGSSKAIIKIIK